MKKTLLLTAALLMVASIAFAGPVGYMGLYADAAHSVCEVMNPGGFFPFTMYIWCQPSDQGTMCAEFSIGYPPNVIQSTVTNNTALISVTLGDLPSGMSVCYVGCQYDWHSPFSQMCYLTDMSPAFITLLPHPSTGEVSFANCLDGFPMEPAMVTNHLALNQPCEIGIEDASWGAIKGMLE